MADSAQLPPKRGNRTPHLSLSWSLSCEEQCRRSENCRNLPRTERHSVEVVTLRRAWNNQAVPDCGQVLIILSNTQLVERGLISNLGIKHVTSCLVFPPVFTE